MRHTDERNLQQRHGRRRTCLRERGNHGTVLIVTIWIVLVLAGLVLIFARAMRVEAIATANHVSALQADAIARGAGEYILSRVDEAEGTAPAEADMPCEAVQIGEGLFWILRPSLEDDQTHAFGMVDEASKINLNSASMEMLSKLPGMTSELAAAILDWRDADDQVSPAGAESEYYLLLPDPYHCKNAPFETIEELLLVRDASAELLYGEDTNRNGVLDANENDAAESAPPDNNDNRLDRGFLDYVTVYSVEPNTSLSGEARVNVNDMSTQALSALLREIVPEDRFFPMMDRIRRRRPFRNILDFYFRAGLNMDEFKPIADRLTVSGRPDLVGRVNVNSASRQVLLCLPGLEEADVDALLTRRADPGADLSSVAWVAEALPQEKAIAVGDHITVRSFQFSADIVAVSGDGRAYRRHRLVLDARQSPPRIVYRKDLTHLGWPLDEAIITGLRAGTPASDIALSSGKGEI